MNESFHAALSSLHPLPKNELERADKIFHLKNLKRGEYFVQAGEIPSTIGFVKSGLLRLYYLKSEGTEFTKSFCMENSFVAAYSALLLKQPSRLYIEALEDTDLLSANYTQYTTLEAENFLWQLINRKIGEQLFIKKEHREAELLLDDAATRYRHFQLECPGLEQRLKQYHIASYLGINPVTLSRIRSEK